MAAMIVVSSYAIRKNSVAVNLDAVKTTSPLDDVVVGVLASVKRIMPRLFDNTSLEEAIENYRNEKDPARKVEFAYDLFALKFQLDLSRKSDQLTVDQKRVIENAIDYANWAANLLIYYAGRFSPQVDRFIDVKLGKDTVRYSEVEAHRIWMADLSAHKAGCSDDDFSTLRAAFSDEVLVGLLPKAVRAMSLVQGSILHQLYDVFKDQILSAIPNDRDRSVVAAVVKVSNAMVKATADLNAEDQKRLDDFLNGKSKDLVYKMYAVAPDCFSGIPTKTVKLLWKFKSELIGKFYLGEIVNFYKKNHKVPEMFELRRPDLSGDKEIYSQPVDGWGRELIFKMNGNNIQLFSSGDDGRPDTEDDFLVAEGPLNQTL
jgi:hypothetical protein